MTATVATNLIAALSWDPQIRGALIVLTALVILPGSVYMLLATNTGAKVGFLLAAAGLFGWMATMGWVWVAYGIGIKGQPAHWDAKEVVTGDVSALSTLAATADFPKGWQKLPTGDPILGDAVSSADKVLAPSQDTGGHAGAATPAPPRIDPVFDTLEDYTLVAGYRKGGENCWLPGGQLCTPSMVGNDGSNPIVKAVKRLQRGPFHKPSYVVIQVKPVVVQPATGGTVAKPTADPSKPPTNVIMVRNLGTLRLKSTFFALANSLFFGLVVFLLHSRDKQIMALRATPAPAH
jgi:hypothetical protein